jgi:hypothetical protein
MSYAGPVLLEIKPKRGMVTVIHEYKEQTADSQIDKQIDRDILKELTV